MRISMTYDIPKPAIGRCLEAYVRHDLGFMCDYARGQLTVEVPESVTLDEAGRRIGKLRLRAMRRFGR